MYCDDIGKCPFCGNEDGETHLSKVPGLPGGKKLPKPHFHVVCSGCAAMGPLSELPKRAIEWWNEVSNQKKKSI
jgi:hypothetical protein